MPFQSLFLVGFLDVFLACVSGHTEDLVIVFAHLADLSVERRVAFMLERVHEKELECCGMTLTGYTGPIFIQVHCHARCHNLLTRFRPSSHWYGRRRSFRTAP